MLSHRVIGHRVIGHLLEVYPKAKTPPQPHPPTTHYITNEQFHLATGWVIGGLFVQGTYLRSTLKPKP